MLDLLSPDDEGVDEMLGSFLLMRMLIKCSICYPRGAAVVSF